MLHLVRPWLRHSSWSACLAVVTALCSARPVMAQAPFTHPGVLQTTADLQRMKAQVAAQAEPYATGWERVRTDPRAKLDYTAQPYAVLQRTPDRASYDALIQDVHAAQLHATIWVVTGEEAHAQKAVQILDAWSNELSSIPSAGEPVLAAGIAGYQLVAAAEILRATYPAWEAGARERLASKLVSLFYPPLHNFLIYHDGDGLEHTETGVNVHYYTNWDAAAMVTIGAIGVFTDDRVKYQEALDTFKNGTGNGNIARAVFDGETGQLMESGRDPEHAQLGIGLLATLAEIAWNQGDDLYGYDDSRLLKGVEYTASYLLGNEVPFATYSDPYRTHTMISQDASEAQVTSAMNTPRPIYEMVWNHYVQRRCQPAPFSRQLAELKRPEGFRGDHVGYGTLLHAREQDCSAGAGGSGQAGAAGSGIGASGAAAGAMAGGGGADRGGSTHAGAGNGTAASGGGANAAGHGEQNASGDGCGCRVVATPGGATLPVALVVLLACALRRRAPERARLRSRSPRTISVAGG